MGRLFWKIFLLTLVAQIIATLAISFALGLVNSTSSQKEVEQTPLASTLNQAAATALQFGGVDAVKKMAINVDLHHTVCILNDANAELMGCQLSAEMIAQIRGSANSNRIDPFVQSVSAADGKRYLVFTLLNQTAQMQVPTGDFALGPDQPPPRPGPPEVDDHFGAPPPGPGPIPGPGSADPRLRKLIPLLFAVFFSLMIAGLIAWYFSRPINQLRSAFKAVAHGDLTTKVGDSIAKRRDELSDLGSDFDAMVNQLNVLIQGHKKLLSDVSHELRSPLARLQFAIGLARQQPDKLAASLDRIENEGQRMEQLVDELLMLAKLEAGLIPADTHEIYMSDIMQEISENSVFEAQALGLQFELTGPFSVIVQANEALVYRALENIIRNAFKHTKPDSTVKLQCSIDEVGNTLRMDVIDQGSGLPIEELSAIFAPFYRSKSNTSQVAGHGLGLAIASRIMDNYHGSIVASNHPDGGLCVRVQLPIVCAESAQQSHL